MLANKTQPYVIVDVFAEAPLRGNPLALVPEADGLSDAAMRAIAAEFNLSETTFLLTATIAGADHRLRSFTPSGDEVFGAGHNALGAWWWLAESGALRGAGRYHQHLGDRALPVTIDRSASGRIEVVMEQGRPQVVGEGADRAALAKALGLGSADVTQDDLSVCVVSTGTPHLLVELVSEAALARAQPDAQALRPLLAAKGAQGCYLYVPRPDGPDAAEARFFNPTVGILEDPATGSAAGPLGWLLARRGLSPWRARITIRQGVALGRESRLNVVAEPDRVTLEGSGVLAAQGQMRIV